jgi:hypothetical protein
MGVLDLLYDSQVRDEITLELLTLGFSPDTSQHCAEQSITAYRTAWVVASLECIPQKDMEGIEKYTDEMTYARVEAVFLQKIAARKSVLYTHLAKYFSENMRRAYQ